MGTPCREQSRMLPATRSIMAWFHFREPETELLVIPAAHMFANGCSVFGTTVTMMDVD